MTEDISADTRSQSQTRSGRCYGQPSDESSFDDNLANSLLPTHTSDSINLSIHSSESAPAPKFISDITHPIFDPFFTLFLGTPASFCWRSHLSPDDVSAFRDHVQGMIRHFSSLLKHWRGAEGEFKSMVAEAEDEHGISPEELWSSKDCLEVANMKVKYAGKQCGYWERVLEMVDEVEQIREREEWQ